MVVDDVEFEFGVDIFQGGIDDMEIFVCHIFAGTFRGAEVIQDSAFDVGEFFGKLSDFCGALFVKEFPVAGAFAAVFDVGETAEYGVIFLESFALLFVETLHGVQ